LKPVPQPGRSWRFDKFNCANPALLSDQQSEQCDQRKTYENYRPIPDIKTKKPTLNPRMCEHVAPHISSNRSIGNVAGKRGLDCCGRATANEKKILARLERTNILCLIS
jgi:hypothetical protein